MGTQGSSKLQVKRGNAPDESRPFVGHGHAEVHKIGKGAVMRAVFEPGWRWSVDVKPIAGTSSCEAAHLGYVISGRMKIRMNDGAEAEMGPGDFFKIEPGHDAWIVGSEPCVCVDFGGYDYAKPVEVAPQRADDRAGQPLGRDK